MFGAWRFVAPLLIAVFFLVVWGVNSSGLLDSLPRLWTQPIRELWANLLILVALMLVICSAGNNDKCLHARIHAEQCLVDAAYDGALEVLRRYDVGDSNISMLAAYALSKKGELAEHLFYYPVTDPP